jgi:uncharacterized LabA/DUF88 family protein
MAERESSETSKIAIYWDFENLHASMADKIEGKGAYYEHRFEEQPCFIDLSTIIDYATSFGDVVINRAYGNWQWFARYRNAFNTHGIDLIQLFPRGASAKNSADIRMALDALADLYNFPHVTHVLVVSSDSDFISLAQKIKQAGKTVIGVGVDGATNQFWMASCNEFKFYEALLNLSKVPDGGMSEQKDEEAPLAKIDLSQARETLVKAMRQLVAKRGENYVDNAGLKIFMKRHLPAFDEQMLGFSTFSAFLRSCSDVVRIVDKLNGGHVALVEEAQLEQPPFAVTPIEGREETELFFPDAPQS